MKFFEVIFLHRTFKRFFCFNARQFIFNKHKFLCQKRNLFISSLVLKYFIQAC